MTVTWEGADTITHRYILVTVGESGTSLNYYFDTFDDLKAKFDVLPGPLYYVGQFEEATYADGEKEIVTCMMSKAGTKRRPE